MKKIFFPFLFLLFSTVVFSQNYNKNDSLYGQQFSTVVPSSQDTVFRIGLILPFQTEQTDTQLERVIHAHDYFSANKVKFNEGALIALDFYQGVLQALKERGDAKISLFVYDCDNSDSATQALLKNPELRTLDIIVGPVSTSQAKFVAEFCNANRILNIQPFSPSKSLTANNPYHVKLAPTIDAHVDAMFQTILDSFQGANIIIYSPPDEKNLSVARRYDSLIRTYNLTAPKEFTVSFINTKDMMVNGKKTTGAEQLKEGRTNVFIITSYEESFVNGNLRMLFEQTKKFDIVLYGMPTWMNGDVIRLDYLNTYRTRVSSPFYIDSSRAVTASFIHAYTRNFELEPTEYSFLGYDLSNWLMNALSSYGIDFPQQLATQRYSGTAYKFDLIKIMAGENINYYESRFVNVYRIEDYKMRKQW